MGGWEKPDLGIADGAGLDKEEVAAAVHQGRVVSQGNLAGLDEEAPIQNTDRTVGDLQRRAVDSLNRAHLLSRGPDVPPLPEDDDHTIQ